MYQMGAINIAEPCKVGIVWYYVGVYLRGNITSVVLLGDILNPFSEQMACIIGSHIPFFCSKILEI